MRKVITYEGMAGATIKTKPVENGLTQVIVCTGKTLFVKRLLNPEINQREDVVTISYDEWQANPC